MPWHQIAVSCKSVQTVLPLYKAADLTQAHSQAQVAPYDSEVNITLNTEDTNMQKSIYFWEVL